MTNRRDFIKTGAAFFAAATMKTIHTSAGAETEATNLKRKVRIGAPLFVPDTDLEAWAKAAVEQGYRAVYAPSVDINDSDRIREIQNIVKKHDLVIAEVGRWVNMMHGDPEIRKKNIETVTNGLAVAEAIGARCCVDIAGSMNPVSWYGPALENYSPEFFELAVENARKIIDSVKPTRAKFCYEAMGWAPPDSPENYLKLFKAIDRNGFGVHVDICNMINSPWLFYHSTDLINRTFHLLGQHIVSAHAKDLRWNVEMNVHFVECVLGQGTVDYDTYLRRLGELPGDVPLMIEHMKNKEEYDQCRDFLKKIAAT